MARPRKSPHLKNQPITISLPPKQIASLDELLTYGANRSRWIQSAIDIKMAGTEKSTPDQIAAQLYALLQKDAEISVKILTLIAEELPRHGVIL
jgi:metal-responsive CopG/Arc/MetJ family transcriptional regulator